MVAAVEKIAKLRGCRVLPPTGLPKLTKPSHALPADLAAFYRLCGGAILFRDAPFGTWIVPPLEFVPANPVIVGEPCDDDNSSNWYIISRQSSEIVTIDLSPERRGRCYDSFWDCHGVRGSCRVVAESFTALLAALLEAEGEQHFWHAPDFADLGDAYD